ncbi:hypothetical protein JNB_00540 [Janibacter sp. HTCC2649]|uniref:DUF2867 domain-containing protein n=1 Tax=Janibacter sp. HTCC2649 TaxID=313589 RepID=UPI000066EBCD|nr:DUF2867 domain-containing protein [Janibacter sp. HTCC2649]EAP98610.1 hypothetical protein JNB_00540 [Janibacter sp. HTCC2649]
MSGRPGFASRALDGVPEPDFADVQLVPLRGATGIAPDDWVRAIFDRRSLPIAVKALFGLRAVLVPFIGLNQARERASNPFEVEDVADGEALVTHDEPHLLFRLGVAVDDEAGLLRATTVVVHHNWRGRLYFVPVGVLHGPVLRSMMLRAVERAR